jgi:hypothetical protein
MLTYNVNQVLNIRTLNSMTVITKVTKVEFRYNSCLRMTIVRKGKGGVDASISGAMPQQHLIDDLL